MNFLNSLNLGTGTEIVGISAICYAVVQAFKQTKFGNHWLPWLSMGVGVAAGLVMGVVQNDTHLVSVAVLGFLIGAATAGLFDGFKAPAVVVKQKNKGATPINSPNGELVENAQDIVKSTINKHFNQLGGEQHD